MLKIGWVDDKKGLPASTQRKALLAAGVHEMKIYDGRKQGRGPMLRDVSTGGALYVYRLSCVARGREDWRDFVAECDEILGDRDLQIGREATLRTTLAAMWADAMADWAQRKSDPRKASKDGKEGAEKRYQDKYEKRMPIAKAKVIWDDAVTYRTVDDALNAMGPGYSKATVYRMRDVFGPRGTTVAKARSKAAVPTKRKRRTRRKTKQ
jgi:hypothetical protein